MIERSRRFWLRPPRTQSLDTNGDGTVDQQEIRSAAATVNAKADLNGNGQIDESEKAALAAKCKAKADLNGDGKIDDSERQALRNTVRQGMQTRQGGRRP